MPKDSTSQATADPVHSPCSDAFCVGEYVTDELLARCWTTGEAVSCLDGDPAANELWLDLITCVPVWWKHDIKFGDDEAQRLETIFGVSAETWIGINDAFQKKRKLQMN